MLAALFCLRRRNSAKPDDKPIKEIQMTKHLFALAIAAAFGIAHAADVKPAEGKPTATPSATVKAAEAPKADAKTAKTKPAAEVKGEIAKP